MAEDKDQRSPPRHISIRRSVVDDLQSLMCDEMHGVRIESLRVLSNIAPMLAPCTFRGQLLKSITSYHTSLVDERSAMSEHVIKFYEAASSQGTASESTLNLAAAELAGPVLYHLKCLRNILFSGNNIYIDAFKADLKPDDSAVLFNYYSSLCTDGAHVALRRKCAYNFPGVLVALGGMEFFRGRNLSSIFHRLVRDSDAGVRRTMLMSLTDVWALVIMMPDRSNLQGSGGACLAVSDPVGQRRRCHCSSHWPP